MITRKCLDPHIDATSAVGKWCQTKWPETLPAGVVFCVPTALAGRRLRDHLADLYGAYEGVRFVTPAHLLDLFGDRQAEHVATAVDMLFAWEQVFQWLQTVDEENLILQKLFPGERAWLDNAASRLAIAQSLHELRHQLTDAALDCTTVAESAACKALSEHEQSRWQALALLEERYRQVLAAAALIDADDYQIQLFKSEAPLPQEAGPLVVVMACVPDFIPALRPLLEKLPELHILMATDDDEAFDPYGCPKHEVWNTSKRHLAVATSSIHPCASADQVAPMLERHLATFTSLAPNDLCLGILDRKLMPAITAMMARHNCEVFEPEPLPLRSQPVGRALLALIHFAQHPEATTLSALIDIPEAHPAAGTSQADVRNGWANAATDFYIDHRHALPLSPHATEADLALHTFRTKVEQWAAALKAHPVQGARDFLIDLWGTQQLSPTEHPIAFAAFETLHDLFELCETATVQGECTLALLTVLLSEQSLRPVRRDATCSYEGRLEWLWSPASVALLVGINEGLYPDSVLSHTFLPDAFRAALGLRSDRERCARDAYILDTLARRYAPQNLFVIPVMANDKGDLLQPSRLLFRCEPDERVKRVQMIFTDTAEPPKNVDVASAIAFHTPLTAWAPWKPPTRFSASKIATFLASPITYFVQSVLNLKEPQSTAEDGLPANRFGEFLHEILAALSSAVGRTPAKAPTGSEPCTPVLMQALNTFFDRHYGTPRTTEVQALYNDFKRRLLSMARLEETLRSEGWETLYVEKDFNISLCVGEQTFELVGRIDRIDRRGNTWRIIDYKTSALSPIKKHYKPSTDTWIDYQLPLYELLVRSTLLQDHPDAQVELAYITLPGRGEAKLECFTYPETYTYESTVACIKETLLQMHHIQDALVKDDLSYRYFNPILKSILRNSPNILQDPSL